MVCKNRGIYGFLGASWVLITVVWLPVLGAVAVVAAEARASKVHLH